MQRQSLLTGDGNPFYDRYLCRHDGSSSIACTCLHVGTDHYFFEGGCRAISIKASFTSKTAEKKFARRVTGKKKPSSKCFLLSRSCVWLKNIFHALVIAHQKKSCTTYKREKKNHTPQNCPIQPHPPQKK